jgi:hypothetical protein
MQSDFSDVATLIVLYRSLTVLCGLAVVVLGYRLFKVGVYEKASELKATWGDKSLLLKQAAPGTIFALFGAAIMAFTVYKGFTLESSLRTTAGTPDRPPQTQYVPWYLGNISPQEISTIKKMMKGEEITAEERASIAQWVNEYERRIKIEAYKPLPWELMPDSG